MLSIIENSPKVLIQGISGIQGRYHTKAMLSAGTKIVAGVVPGGQGKIIHGIPVYNKISEAQNRTKIDVSIVFVPAPFCKSALMEAVDARIPLIICITEGLPVHDFLAVKQHAEKNGVRIVGPNGPGILMPNVGKFGIIPETVSMQGKVSIVSRSGTLAYETANALTTAGIGQRVIIGIGGDPIKGTTFVDCLQELRSDNCTEAIVLVGEIGGQDEQLAAEYISKQQVTKPIYAYVAGQYAPLNKQFGHAGAIIKTSNETAQAKTTLLKECGVQTCHSVDDLVRSIIDQIE